MKKIGLLSVGLYLCLVSVCQVSQVKEYHRLSKAFYASVDSFSLSFEVLSYNSYDGENPEESIKGTLWVKEGAFRANYPSLEILDNGVTYINCYRNSGIMYCAPSTIGKQYAFEYVSLDSLLFWSSEITTTEIGNLVQVNYTIDTAHVYSPYIKVQTTFDKSNFEVTKQTVYYDSAVFYDYFTNKSSEIKMEIRYSGLNAKPVFRKNIFSTDEFFKEVNQQKTAVGFYKGFQVIEVN